MTNKFLFGYSLFTSFFIGSFFCQLSTAYCQTSKIDSLQKVLETIKPDTNKVITLNELSIELYNIAKYEEALKFAEQSKQLANHLIAKNKNLTISKVIKKGLARAFNTFGNIYSDQGIYTDALENYFASLKIKEEIGDKKGIASTYNNIGIVYKTQGNLPDALSNYLASLKIKEELGDKQGIASSYNNIGNIYHLQGEFTQALENYSASLKLFNEIGFKAGMVSLYINIGSVYYNQAKKEMDKIKQNNLLAEARKNYIASLTISEEIGDKRGIAATFINIGAIELMQKNSIKAKEYANKALQISKNDGGKEILKDSYSLLTDVERSLGNYQKAFENFQLFILLRDSLFNEENTKKTVQMQMQFGFDKKMAADSIANAKSQEIKEVEINKQKIEIKAKRFQQFGLIGVLVLVVIFAGFMYNRYRITQNQKKIIELQKHEVEKQKEIVDEKNKEITDSIQYAKRIQNAILPPIKLVKEFLPQSFIVYKPKDIVAGDFYWMETVSSLDGGLKVGDKHPTNSSRKIGTGSQRENIILFAAADCTGHGVPGAMVSVICNNGLNRSVREYGITDPGKILDNTRKIVIQEFEKSDDVVKDGMDIALCSLEFNVQSLKSPKSQTSNSKLETVATLQYAGANNPLWIIRPYVIASATTQSHSNEQIVSLPSLVRNDGKVEKVVRNDVNFELIEIKPNKQHIGKIENPQPFITHTIELQKNDTIYIFTDGYQDQFGGEHEKKFKSSKLKELLLNIQEKTMNDQQEIIIQTFEKWKGNAYQIDDVCVIGVRI